MSRRGHLALVPPPPKGEPTPRREDQRRRARFSVVQGRRLHGMPRHLRGTYVNLGLHADRDGYIRASTTTHAAELGYHRVTIERHYAGLVAIGEIVRISAPTRGRGAVYRLAHLMTPEDRAEAVAKFRAQRAALRARRAANPQVRSCSTGDTTPALAKARGVGAPPSGVVAPAAKPHLADGPPATAEERAAALAKIRADLAARRHPTRR